MFRNLTFGCSVTQKMVYGYDGLKAQCLYIAQNNCLLYH